MFLDYFKVSPNIPDPNFQTRMSACFDLAAYIPSNERESLAENVLNFEPEISLFVENENPIIFYEAIVKYAKSNLSENGFLFFEIHPDFSVEISDLLKLKGFINIEQRKDLQGKNRMIKAQNP